MFFSIVSKNEDILNEFKLKIQNLNSDLKYVDFNLVKSKKVDYLFILGGDGTFLKVLKKIIDLDLKIILINTGRLGFLSSINNLNQICFEQEKYSSINYLNLKTNNKNLISINEIIINFNKLTYIKFYLNNNLFKQIYCSQIIIINNIGTTGIARSYGYPIILNDNNQFIIDFKLEPIYNYYKPLLQPIILDTKKDVNLTFDLNTECKILVDNVEHKINTNSINLNLFKSKIRILNINNLEFFIKKINDLF